MPSTISFEVEMGTLPVCFLSGTKVFPNAGNSSFKRILAELCEEGRLLYSMYKHIITSQTYVRIYTYIHTIFYRLALQIPAKKLHHSAINLQTITRWWHGGGFKYFWLCSNDPI